MRRFSTTTLLLAVALLFHGIGLAGIGFLHTPAVLRATPVHLALMTLLLLIAARNDRRFYPWALGVALVGFAAEWIGVHTAALFGHYHYGTVLGPGIDGIPWVIGLNWVLVVAGAASIAGLGVGNAVAKSLLAAGLATGFDWILEPVAVKLGYWTWAGGIPFYNYGCWTGLSFFMALTWYSLKIRPNQFAVILFWIQAVFFAALRLLL